MLSFRTAFPQSTPEIKKLEMERGELHRRITESESLLQSTGKDVKSLLDNLSLVSGQISERKKYLSIVQEELDSIRKETNRLEAELKALDNELAVKRKRYGESLVYLRRNGSIQEKLMFVFSADNLGQMYRRMRYVRQYADLQRLKGEEIKVRQARIEEKKKATEEAYRAKTELLGHQEAEKKKLEAQETERKRMLKSAQDKQVRIRKELERQRRSANKLEKEIDRLIAAEAEAARKKAEELRRKESAAKNSGKTGREGVDTSAGGQEHKLSGVFERNRGRLPVPVTGSYVVVGHYGQYQVEGLRNVRLDNKGIDIRAKDGAMARTVFDGEVSAVFRYNGLANVLVRHGSYISVYCNLESVIVKKGSQLKTGDMIGRINTDRDGNTLLHFQLRRETVKLNPEQWIRL